MASASVYGANIPNQFHNILDGIFHNELKQIPETWTAYLDKRTTTKRWVQQVEMVDPALWSETDEGNQIDLAEFAEGMVVTYRPVKWAQRLVIPEEVFEDAEYEEAYDATRMMARTLRQTQNYEGADILDDAFNSAVTGGDGLEMCSTAHVIRGGQTVSNELATPLAPSNAAFQTMLTMCAKMRGTNGFIASVRPKWAFGAADYTWRMREILKSEQRDDTANNAINALRGDVSTYKGVPEMASTTNWFLKTDAMRGAQRLVRRAPRYREGNTIENETRMFTGSTRFVDGWTNWRWVIGSAI